VLLYEMLTGQTPLDAKELLSLGLDEMRRAIREKEPVRPSTRLSTLLEGDLTSTAQLRQVDLPKLIHQLRGDLDWIVMKALEKDRARRYETANGFAMDIQRHLNNEPVVARPPSAAYRFQKLVRRNKVAFVAAGAVAMALVLGVIASTWQAARALRARNDAKANEVKARHSERLALAEKNRADEQAEQARQNAAESRERLVRLAVANGVRLQNEGDFPDALLWFAHALALEEGDPVKERMHRLRCASALQHCPKLIQIIVGPVQYAEFSPDGNRVATAGNDRSARVWDVTTGEPITSVLEHEDRTIRACFSPDGQRVLTTSGDGTARIWNSDTGEQLVVLRHASRIDHAEFSPDGRRVLTAGYDKKAQVWDATTAQPLLPPLIHSNAVVLTRFSPDGQRIVTASAD